MGYDKTRFDCEVDQEYMCSICAGVLEEPLHDPQCEHAFCKSCINEWLTKQPSCPVDRQRVTTNDLKPVPRVLRNLLSKLMIKCDHAQFGCTTVVQLESLEAHKQECEYDPKRPVPCVQGCGLTVPKDELKDHNCVKEVRRILQTQIHEMQCTMNLALNEMRREIRSMKSYSPMQVHIPAGVDDTTRWANSLQRVRVRNWASLFVFPVPDPRFNNIVQRALYDSGCPASATNELMKSVVEREWPVGLRTPALRDLNWQYYRHYVCRRIPGLEAVVIMAVENPYMNGNMIRNPGHVMIFDKGVQ